MISAWSKGTGLPPELISPSSCWTSLTSPGLGRADGAARCGSARATPSTREVISRAAVAVSRSISATASAGVATSTRELSTRTIPTSASGRMSRISWSGLRSSESATDTSSRPDCPNSRS